MPYDGNIKQMHPKQIENIRKAEARRAAKLDAREFEHDLTGRYGLRYVHVRGDCAHPLDMRLGIPCPKGGVTVAYQLPPRKGDRLIAVSCALCHENDSYVKQEGRLRAAAKFHAGERMKLRVPRNMTTSEFLKRMFGAML